MSDAKTEIEEQIALDAILWDDFGAFDMNGQRNLNDCDESRDCGRDDLLSDYNRLRDECRRLRREIRTEAYRLAMFGSYESIRKQALDVIRDCADRLVEMFDPSTDMDSICERIEAGDEELIERLNRR